MPRLRGKNLPERLGRFRVALENSYLLKKLVFREVEARRGQYRLSVFPEMTCRTALFARERLGCPFTSERQVRKSKNDLLTRSFSSRSSPLGRPTGAEANSRSNEKKPSGRSQPLSHMTHII